MRYLVKHAESKYSTWSPDFTITRCKRWKSHKTKISKILPKDPNTKMKKLTIHYIKTPVTKFRSYIRCNRFTTFLFSTAAVDENKSLKRTPVSCHDLSKYYIVIRVLTSESARSIIIRIAVSPRTVALEVYSRRTALAHIWIIELTTTAVLVCIVGQTRALAGYHVAVIPDFQIIRTSRVKINVTTSRCAGVSVSTSNSWCHLKGNIMICMTNVSTKNNMCWRATSLICYVG